MLINAHSRSESGKGISRKLRKENKIPVVVYGSGEPVSLSIPVNELQKAYRAGGFWTTKHTLDVDGKDKIEVLARDVQTHVVNGLPLHADFMRFDPKKQVRVNVAIKVTGEKDSPGLVKGGVLQLVRTEVEMVCRADSIPEELVISMAGTDIGDSVHMSSIELPDGVRPAIADRDFTIASVVGTRTSTMANLAEGEAGADSEGESTEAEAAEEAKEE